MNECLKFYYNILTLFISFSTNKKRQRLFAAASIDELTPFVKIAQIRLLLQ